jgi:pimeloyl-[acyl-carrier protein] methyl ester esterase
MDKQHPLNLTQFGRGLPLSWLHGWGMNSAVFTPVVESMRDGYRHHLIDLPGYGRSSTEPTYFEEELEYINEALPPSILVAWSMGGLYALELLRRFPQKYAGLVLIASNPCFVQREDWSAAMSAEVFTDFADDLIGDWRATMRRFIGLQLHGVEGARDLIRQVSQLVASGGEPRPGVLQQGLDRLIGFDVRTALTEIQVPVMAILGRRDKLVPVGLAQELSALNPAIRVECLARSAHAPFLSHPEEFIRLIDEFTKSAAT